MNKDQIKHLENILKTTNTLLEDKYIRGAQEHKTTLNKDHGSLELIDMAIEEAIDQITYLLTIKEVLQREREF